MFLDKNKTKIAILQVEYYKTVDASGINERIYDKKTRKKIDTKSIGIYPGKPRVEATWRHYKLALDVDGKDPNTEYFTDEQYKACWKPNSLCDINVDYIWIENFKDFIIYEQDHYGNKPRKVKNPENRYLEKTLPKKSKYFQKGLELTKAQWAEKRKKILAEAQNNKKEV